MLQSLRFPLALGFTLTLAACASDPSGKLGNMPDTHNANLDKTLLAASKKTGHQATALYLSAADLAKQQGDSLKARSLLESLNLDDAPPAQQLFAATLAAELAVDRKQPDMALQSLQHPVFSRLSEFPLDQQIRSQDVKARALQASGQSLAAVRERIFMAGLLSGARAMDNQEQIWTLVKQLPENTSDQGHEPELSGWLQLAGLTLGNSALPRKQQDIRHWLESNAQHPAAILPPSEVSHLLAMQARSPQRIALLLPSQDRNQNVVNAIRNGFLARYYQSKEAGHDVPELRFFDSSQISSLGELYQNLQHAQIDLLIGPWEKDLVRQLSTQNSLPIATLALNYADTNQTTGNLYQFGLSADDEARMAADRAWADGLRNAVVLVQAGEWGNRVQAAFTARWQSLGGQVVDSIALGQPAELTRQLGNLMRLGDSEARSKQLADTLQTRVHSQPGRRRDIDFVFLAAPSQVARQVRPALIFQYAGDLPVYATSAINPGVQDPGMLHDLDGINFSEVPWLLGTTDPIKNDILTRWPDAAGLMGRFYAMGADAYQLAMQLQMLEALPSSSTLGLSGQMQLTPQLKVQRTSSWARFNDGKLERLP